MKHVLLTTSRKSYIKKLVAFSKPLIKYLGKFDYTCVYKNEYKKEDYRKYNLIISLGVDNEHIYNCLFKPFIKSGNSLIVLGSGLFYNKSLNPNMCVFINGTHFTKFGCKYESDTYDTSRIKKFFVGDYSVRSWINTSKDKILIFHYKTPTWDGKSKEPFYDNIYKECFNSGRRVIFRPQPHQKYNSDYIEKLKNYGFIIKDTNINPTNLYSSLYGCSCSVSYGGKSPSKSIIYGVPSITCNYNMADLVSEKDICKLNSPRMPDREQWFKWLSYCHWDSNEIQDGCMWEYYFSRDRINV